MLKFQNVCFSYKKKEVLKNLSFTLARGEILAVMGPSGCGKSTLLNLAAGLRKPTEGSIENHAQKIAYVFQEPRLFPWLTVAENVSAVLAEKQTEDETVERVLEAVGLTDAKDQFPASLSGGMKSRASLARALAYGGDLFLLDEPFAALDESMRMELAEYLKGYLHTHNASAIIVTHQLSDAQALADQIMELKQTD